MICFHITEVTLLHIDHYMVAVYTTDVISEVRVVMLAICMHRRGFMTIAFTSTITSNNIS